MKTLQSKNCGPSQAEIDAASKKLHDPSVYVLTAKEVAVLIRRGPRHVANLVEEDVFDAAPREVSDTLLIYKGKVFKALGLSIPTND